MPPEREIRLDSVLESRQPPLVEPRRGSTPESQRALELARRRFRVAGSEPLAAVPHELLEPVEVQLSVLDAQPVARRLRGQTVRTECLPQLGHVPMERLHRRVGRLLAPELVDQFLGADDPVAVEQKDPQERERLAGRQRNGPSPIARFDLPEDQEFHGGSMIPRRFTGA